jgi:hypothetical protein
MSLNVIILTSGLTGSSVLTGLISRAGYWAGDNTHKKREYDTYENTELIELNRRILKEATYSGNYLMEFSPEAISRVSSMFGEVDSQVYNLFVSKCNEHRPWVWKDPRLWLTIRFWKHLLDLEECRFVLLTRGSVQSWISQTLRRQITTYRYSRSYEGRIKRSIIDFVEENRVPYLPVCYEDLILRPAETIDALNRYLQTSLTVEDLKSVYHKRLYKNPRSSLVNHVKAILIYVKNYSERLDVRPNTQERA